MDGISAFAALSQLWLMCGDQRIARFELGRLPGQSPQSWWQQLSGRQRLLSALRHLPALIDLGLHDYTVDDWAGLSSLTRLQSLTLSNCQLLRVPAGLTALKNLTALRLDATPSMPGLPGLAALPSLRRLILRANMYMSQQMAEVTAELQRPGLRVLLR
jgi:hypothetical protein